MNSVELHDIDAAPVLSDCQQWLLRDGPEAQAVLYHWEASQRRAVSFLLVGSVSGLLGFLVAGGLGMQKYYHGGIEHLWNGNRTYIVENNFMGEPFSSGHNYQPQTVSELVHNQESPEGKAFFAFGLVAAICILLSWYPWQLRNVYLGDDVLLCGCCGPTWQNIRQFLPPLGMFLVACIPTAPPVNRKFGDYITVGLHTVGALMMVGGYSVCEILTLSSTQGRRVNFKSGEKFARATLIGLSLTAGIAFQVCGLLSPKPVESLGTDSCGDVWVVPSQMDLEYVMQSRGDLSRAVSISEARQESRKLLLDTASGRCLTLKFMEYWLEVISGLFMVANLFAVWWYCPERQLDLPEMLPELEKQELRRQGYPRQLTVHLNSYDEDDDSLVSEDFEEQGLRC